MTNKNYLLELTRLKDNGFLTEMVRHGHLHYTVPRDIDVVNKFNSYKRISQHSLALLINLSQSTVFRILNRF